MLARASALAAILGMEVLWTPNLQSLEMGLKKNGPPRRGVAVSMTMTMAMVVGLQVSRVHPPRPLRQFRHLLVGRWRVAHRTLSRGVCVLGVCPLGV
jgi:hypothetical protein